VRRATWRAFRYWLSVPWTASGRRGFLWYLGTDVPATVVASDATPQVTWSQDGEDLLFDETFPEAGYYVDVGAHHPDRFSVTRKLYDRGWSGVNIDYSPDFLALFTARRPRDTNVQALVGQPRQTTFWRFEEAALSTLDEGRAKELAAQGWPLKASEPVAVRGLADVLEEAGVPPAIDLLSVDVEGEDFDVLSSMDWDRWHVERCLAEVARPAHLVPGHPISMLLAEKGFSLTRVWGRSCLFERTDVPDSPQPV
jgi:FkbM family methyltransferase